MQSTSVIREASVIGHVEEIDEEDEEAHIDFLEDSGNLARLSKSKKPKKVDHVWIPLVNVICIVLEPTATKRALKICPEVLDNVFEKPKIM